MSKANEANVFSKRREHNKMTERTPIILITGSLGCGKTTLLQKILDGIDLRLAILMNEFGELAIDSQILQGENVKMVELDGGCVCCELTGEFEAAVKEVIQTAKPEIIVVEATGVAEADALVYEVEDNLPQVRLDCVICIVDAFASIKYPHMGYTTRTQLEVADIILINKTDLISSEEYDAVTEQVQKFNESATLFKTVQCKMDIKLLFGLDIKRHALPEIKPVGHGFQSFSFTTAKRLRSEKFLEWITDLPGAVYRAKGFVRLDTGDYLLNYVAGRLDMADFQAKDTQLVIIGRGIGENQESLLTGLQNCEI
jgi:G3E family GTPase